MIVLYVVMTIAVAFFTVLYVLYDMIFKRKNRGANGIVKKFVKYDKFRESIRDNIRRIKELEYETIKTTASDGIGLAAKFYKLSENAPVAVFFHGYRSYAEFDGSYLFHILRECGCSVLLVEQRAHSQSRARSITFGVKESDDCVRWVDFLANMLGASTRIILCGMSMGASTVMMASDADFRADVRGIIADCGFYSPGEAIRHSIKMRGYPAGTTYFLARLAARIFAGFDPESRTTGDSLSKSDIPILIIHGDADKLVPYEMGMKNYNAACSEKKLVTVRGAGHAVSGGVNPELYKGEIRAFLDKVL